MAATFSALSAFTAANASTISAIGTAAAVAGTGYTAIAGYQAAKQQQATARYNAQVARQSAQARESQIRRDNARRIASATATLGASGISLQGTPLMVLSDLVSQAEEEALLARYGGAVDSSRAAQRASAYGAQATSSLLGGGIGTATTLLQGTARHVEQFPILS